ncbi:MAG TPA: SRPBCC domain-containing protein [Phnomibacter sp.]|nr:SRPBCC domain-containing protein [Phnomibacter sp.]
MRIERLFDAKPIKLWSACTQPKQVSKWLGSDPNGTVEEVLISLVPGGTYLYVFADADGTRHVAFGAFLTIEPCKKLKYSWEWEAEPGHISYLEWEFLENQHQTLVVLTHSNLNPTSSHGYSEGWSRTLTKLAKSLL